MLRAIWKSAWILFLLPPLGHAGQDAEANKAKSPATLALKGLDPVLLTQGKEVAGKKELALTRGDYRYLFDAASTRAAFEKDPARYEIQLRGHCGVMPNIKGDPDLFAVHDGRIYVFGTTACRTAFLASPKKFLEPTKKKNVAIFVHQGVELLDFAGPGEVFATAKLGRAYNVYTVAASTDAITSGGFLTVKPQYSLTDCPKPDILVIPGGSTNVPLADPKVIEWIKKTAGETEVTMSVCTGAFLLAKAGLLEGKEATTHWGAIDRLKKMAPKTVVHSDRRIVDNGKIVTTAGVSAGIDGALHVVGRLLGAEAAKDTARYMEYRWEPVTVKGK